MTGSDSSAVSASILVVVVVVVITLVVMGIVSVLVVVVVVVVVVGCWDSVNPFGCWRGEGFSVSGVVSWLLRKTSSFEWSEASSLVIYIIVTEMMMSVWL